MRISRFATPAALVAFASAFAPSCESSECAEEVCFEGQGGTPSGASGAGGDEDGQGGFSAAAGLNGTGGKSPTGGASTAGTPGSGGSAGDGTAGTPQGGAEGGTGGGEAGSGGEGGAVPICDPSKAPSAEACLVSDEFAVFVSPLGNDEGTGAKGDPVLSIASAITMAAEQQKIVVACSTNDAVFTVPLELAGEVTARVYGGFDCDDWTHGDVRTLIAPEAKGPALKLDTVSGALEIEDFEFRARDAEDGNGENSVGAVISDTKGVTLRRVTIAAGKGGKGADGQTIAGFAGDALDGHAAEGENGGDPRTSSQCGCDTSGGAGGDASGTTVNGADGLPAYGGGKGGTGGGSCSAGLGGDGENAPLASSAPGATSLGKLDGIVWQPSSGTVGETGKPGQGGGGGGGEGDSPGGAGGGGACGGCGGQGGNPGGGGGASIGLILVSSTVVLQETSIVTDDAGQGGKGAAGQDGQRGGTGGDRTGQGCLGGNGGDGASGGSGGGGAGGLSAGIVYSGTAPNVLGVSFDIGMLGDGGDGGTPNENDGIDGKTVNFIDADA
jgi:hypothetical protein